MTVTNLPINEVRPLDQHHERAAFSCGDTELDRYLQNFAGQNMRSRTAVVWVLTRPPSKTAIGYYTLTNTKIDVGPLPPEVTRKLKLKSSHHPGATLLGRFAISAEYQRQGLGELLLMDVFTRALEVSKIVSSVGVVLDASSDDAKAFWKAMEFIPMGVREDGMERFFLPMEYIENLLGGSD